MKNKQLTYRYGVFLLLGVVIILLATREGKIKPAEFGPQPEIVYTSFGSALCFAADSVWAIVYRPKFDVEDQMMDEKKKVFFFVVGPDKDGRKHVGYVFYEVMYDLGIFPRLEQRTGMADSAEAKLSVFTLTNDDNVEKQVSYYSLLLDKGRILLFDNPEAADKFFKTLVSWQRGVELLNKNAVPTNLM